MQTNEPKITVDVEALAASGADDIIKSLGEVDAETREIIHRTTRRITAIAVLSLSAPSPFLAELQVERNVLISTLLNTLEERGAAIQGKIESFLLGILGKATDVVFGRLGL